jgi:hypothetical protein
MSEVNAYLKFHFVVTKKNLLTLIKK